jgi:uncharacterized protein involved in outer membrane biogenesis
MNVSLQSYRRLRRVTIALALVVAIPLGAVLAVVFGMNPFVRAQVESLAASLLKVPVAMDRARINLLGAVRFERLAVGNPLPFKEVRAFRTDLVAADVSLASAFKDTIEVNEVVIVHPRIIVEAGRERLNWSVLMDHLKPPAGRPLAEKVKRKEKKFIIRRLRIIRPVIVVRSPKMSQGGTEVVLRNIELEGVGTGPGKAATLSLVLATVFQALLTGAIDEWGALPNDVPLAEITSRTSKAYGDDLKTAAK